MTGEEIVKDGVRYIDMTPTPAEAENMLRHIIAYNVNAKEREWARKELIRITPAIKRGSWTVNVDDNDNEGEHEG